MDAGLWCGSWEEACLAYSTTYSGYGGPFNPSTQEVEEGGSGVESHPWL